MLLLNGDQNLAFRVSRRLRTGFFDEHYLYFTDKTKLLPPDRFGDVINQI